MEFVVKVIDISWVKVTGRHRKNLGDLTELVESIRDTRLINPITVTEDGSLIAGHRRLEAYRLLGRAGIPARIISDLAGAAERLKIERDENTARKPMTPGELVSLGKALEALERPRATARMKSGTATEPEPSDRAVGGLSQSKGEIRDVVAEAIGMSPMSYYRAKTVAEAAQDPTASPEDRRIAEAALAEMNATGVITPAYEKVRKIRPAGDQPPPPRSKYSLDKAAGQRRAFNSAVTTLSGIAHGLRQIEAIHPDITNVEAAQWVDGLSESRQAISMLIKLLRECTNAEV